MPAHPTRAYLDHNATSPLRPAALAAMHDSVAAPGNASSIHAEGRAARALVETARSVIAAFAGGPARAVVFTSGGTEALNLALTPQLASPGRNDRFERLLIGAGEHAAAMAGHRFPAECAEIIPLAADGALDLAALKATLARPGGRPMLALQAANNETGVVQPVAAAAELVHAAGGFVVCDAVQAAAKIECGFASLGADALILSAHKFGGPQGAGALCFADAGAHIGEAMVRGGGQERGVRAGTENVAGIAGMAAALDAAGENWPAEQAALGPMRDRLESEIARLAPDAVFFGAGRRRLANTSCFALPGFEAQVLLMLLDIEGVAVSSGSACSSGKVMRSHVLAAMGVAPALAAAAIRVSLGWTSTESDCARFLTALEKAVRTQRARPAKAAAA